MEVFFMVKNFNLNVENISLKSRFSGHFFKKESVIRTMSGYPCSSFYRQPYFSLKQKTLPFPTGILFLNIEG